MKCYNKRAQVFQVQCPQFLSDLNEKEMRQISVKIPSMKFHSNLCRESQKCFMQADSRTDMMEPVAAFRKLLSERA